jgi:hypothetical protein
MIIKSDSNKYAIFSDNDIMITNYIYDDIFSYHDGFAIVKLNNKFNFIKDNGEILFTNIWFDHISSAFNKFGLAQVCYNKKWGIVNNKGNIIISINFNEPLTTIKYSKFYIAKNIINDFENYQLYHNDGTLLKIADNYYYLLENINNAVLLHERNLKINKFL